MDSSVYVPTQSNMITLTGGNSSNDITCTFGPVLFDVLKAVGNNIGGSQYILGKYSPVHHVHIPIWL